jgi:hypothetical protein
MKQLFLSIASILVFAISSFASDKNGQAHQTRSWSADQKFSSILVKGNVTVVLVHHNSNVISIEGVEKFVNAVHLEVENGQLKITGKKGPGKRHTIIHVPVQDLNSVTLRGGTKLNTLGSLNAKKLCIRVEGTSTVNVKNIGEVIIESDDKHEFTYQTSEKRYIRLVKS